MTSTYIERSIAVRVVASGYIPRLYIQKLVAPMWTGQLSKASEGERERGREGEIGEESAFKEVG